MTVDGTVLALHVAAGALALVLGPLALYASRRGGRQDRLADAYHWAVLGVGASALLLVALDITRLWWFIPIAAGSYALALLGRVAGVREGSRSAALRVHGLGGSYIALVTAVMVVSVGSPLGWVAPTLIGSPLVARAARRARVAPVDRGATGASLALDV